MLFTKVLARTQRNAVLAIFLICFKHGNYCCVTNYPIYFILFFLPKSIGQEPQKGAAELISQELLLASAVERWDCIGGDRALLCRVPRWLLGGEVGLLTTASVRGLAWQCEHPHNTDVSGCWTCLVTQSPSPSTKENKAESGPQFLGPHSTGNKQGTNLPMYRKMVRYWNIHNYFLRCLSTSKELIKYSYTFVNYTCGQ